MRFKCKHGDVKARHLESIMKNNCFKHTTICPINLQELCVECDSDSKYETIRQLPDLTNMPVINDNAIFVRKKGRNK